jgi:hypothetical protein
MAHQCPSYAWVKQQTFYPDTRISSYEPLILVNFMSRRVRPGTCMAVPDFADFSDLVLRGEPR